MVMGTGLGGLSTRWYRGCMGGGRAASEPEVDMTFKVLTRMTYVYHPGSTFQKLPCLSNSATSWKTKCSSK